MRVRPHAPDKPTRAAASSTKIPASIHWKVQKRLAGW